MPRLRGGRCKSVIDSVHHCNSNLPQIWNRVKWQHRTPRLGGVLSLDDVAVLWTRFERSTSRRIMVARSTAFPPRIQQKQEQLWCM